MSDRMLQFHLGRTVDRPELDAKKAWRPITDGLRDWRSQLTPPDVECVEAAAGGLLGALAYPRLHPRPSAASSALAAELRARYVAELAAQGARFPTSWLDEAAGRRPMGSGSAAEPEQDPTR
jgi:hypothetical protein